ncbi:ABC transporter ATP-binding protein [Tautonia sociabilis]|uniref:ABC transporter ATP-binding protein n=1 Tax=Tautonia sociabilis TaxID=2080755 RepID=A0A432MDJ0_9BACT|nr:ABC transporter ATP-binding protein [Tautonia sociabilis]RUL82796.1 ABC transporter ATP-binding protein [Tautonia sociabilis]
MDVVQLVGVKKAHVDPAGGRCAVLDVERWVLGAGEQAALLGHSGSGKTTLLHVIAGLTLPDEGSVRVADCELTGLDEPARDRFRAGAIGYVYQTLNLLDGFSSLENVLLGMTFGGRPPDERRARDLLDRVGLGHRLHHRPEALSVGERQRVAVARALLARPTVMLADEPTAHLDPVNQRQVIDLIRSACREESVALLLVTHAPDVAEAFERVESIESFNRAAKGIPAKEVA